MDKIIIEVDDLAKVSDGYHTIDELYEHRCLLFIANCLSVPHLCLWKKDFDGWFLLVQMSITFGQISYHIKEKHLQLISKKIREDDGSYVWDGHTSGDVLKRLEKYCEILGEVGGYEHRS